MSRYVYHKRPRSETPVPRCWHPEADSDAAVTFAIPHTVVSQILRPEIAAFLLNDVIRIHRRRDAQCCVTKLYYAPGSDSDDESVDDAWKCDPICGVGRPGVATAEVEGDDLSWLIEGDPREASNADSNTSGRNTNAAAAQRQQRLLAVELGDSRVPDRGTVSEREVTLESPPRRLTLPLLTALDLTTLSRANEGEGVDAQFLSRMADIVPALKMLLVRDCFVDAACVAQICRLTHLTDLDVKDCDDIGTAALESLSCLTKLQHLCPCSGVTCSVLRKWAEHLLDLRTLDLSENRDADVPDFLEISKFKNLTYLSTGRTPYLTVEACASLSKLSQLRTLVLSECGFLGAAGLAALLPGLRNLQDLSLTSCFDIDAEALAHLSHVSATLQSLALSGCAAITDAALAHISKLSALRCLRLSYCRALTAVGVTHLSKLKRLRTLDLANCGKIKAAFLLDLSRFPALHSLVLPVHLKATNGAVHVKRAIKHVSFS